MSRRKGIDWDKRRAKQKQWRENNKEILRKKKKSYYDSHYNIIQSERSHVWRRNSTAEYLLHSAKSRAKKKDLEFNINTEDIVVPEYCPVLNLKLEVATNKIQPNSPTVDRIDNNKGYIKGNVQVISNRANRMKNDSSFEEIELLYLFMKRLRN